MADPNEMVEVYLTIKRPYRVKKEDRTAIEVGPGRVSVPRWVAEAWKLTPLEPVNEPVEPLPVKPAPAKQSPKKAVKRGS